MFIAHLFLLFVVLAWFKPQVISFALANEFCQEDGKEYCSPCALSAAVHIAHGNMDTIKYLSSLIVAGFS